MVENTRFTYSEIMVMPTHERRYYIKLKTEQSERRAEQTQERITQTGKSERVIKVSGEQVKEFSGKKSS